MFTFGWTSFNPLDTESGSQDPLKSLGLAMRLGELLFPGTSGRVWRPRYLSELCYAITLAEPDPQRSYRDNYLGRVRMVENFFLVLRVLRMRTNPDQVGHVIGKSKVEGLIRANETMNMRDELMINQIALGPLGIHLVTLVAMKLVDPENLTLTVAGEDLAERYRRSLARSAEKIESLVATLPRGLRTEAVDGDILGDLGSVDGKRHPEDTNLLQELLIQDPIRRQVIHDLTNIDESKATLDDQSCLLALNELDSPLSSKYSLALQFDRVMRCLYFSFNNLLILRTPSVRRPVDHVAMDDLSFEIIRRPLTDAIEGTSKAMRLHEESFEDPKAAISGIRDFTNDIAVNLKDQTTYFTFLLEFHEQHQKSKGKAPWIKRLDANLFEVLPSQRREAPGQEFQEAIGQNIHQYRMANAWAMIRDLGMRGAA